MGKEISETKDVANLIIYCFDSYPKLLAANDRQVDLLRHDTQVCENQCFSYIDST